MAKISLDLRCKKARHVPIMLCLHPHPGEKCSGKFIRTRVAQRECVECMKINNTILKHPLYKKLTKYKCDII